MLEELLFGMCDWASLRNHTKRPSNVAVLLNLELLGDYALWAPYGRACVNHWRTRGLKTIVIGNASWAELAAKDLQADQLIPIDVRQFLRNLSYRIRLLSHLRDLGARFAISAGHPRDYVLHDACVRALAAPCSIGFEATFGDRPELAIGRNRGLYSILVPTDATMTRIDKHARMLRAAGITPPASPLDILPDTVQSHLPAGPYLVISPCASRPEKTWPPDRFVQVARRALEAYPSLFCVFVGAPSERKLIDSMQIQVGGRAINLAGTNSLSQLQQCIKSAVAVVCNDSAAAHFAALAGTPCVVAMNGATYGHCLPYPDAPADPVFPTPPILAAAHMDCYGCDWNCRYPIAPGSPFPCLSAVTVDQVWVVLNQLIKQRSSHNLHVI